MTKQQGWSLARLRGAIYAVAMMVGFLAPVQPATYTGPRTLWVWLGVWQSTMGITSTTGIVLVTWLAVLLTVLGALLRLWAARRRMPRARRRLGADGSGGVHPDAAVWRAGCSTNSHRL